MPPIKSDVHLTPDRVWKLIKDNWNYHKDEFFDPCPINPKFNGLDIVWHDLNFVKTRLINQANVLGHPVRRHASPDV